MQLVEITESFTGLASVNFGPNGPEPIAERASEFPNLTMSVTPREWLQRVGRTMTGRFKDFRRIGELEGTESGDVVLVGGGPSLKATLSQIRARKAAGAKIFALNCSHDWLIEQGIIPDYASQADGREWVDYITPREGVKYILYSQLRAETLEKFLPFADQTYIAHFNFPAPDVDTVQMLMDAYPGISHTVFGFGSTIGITSLSAANMLGFGYGECHGYDSAFGEQTHAYKKPVVRGDIYTAHIQHGADKFSYQTNVAMEYQATTFAELLADRGDMEIKIGVAGYGAIPWLAWKGGNENIFHAYPDEMAVYMSERKAA